MLADHDLAWALASVCSRAGAAVMRVYAGDPAAWTKPDGSLCTAADEEAEAIILAALDELAPDIPVLAEERHGKEGAARLGAAFFLVDPLDGTKEFISRNGEFTVNIALVRQGAPACGCVYAPALETMYLGAVGAGAWAGAIRPGDDVDRAAFRPITARAFRAEDACAVVSRSHADPETEAFLSRLGARERRAIGSSLKFCLLAVGEADVYPRFGPTMEWDVAAGHAVLAAAGGRVVDADGSPFLYGKADQAYRNGPFIAWGAGAPGI